MIPRPLRRAALGSACLLLCSLVAPVHAAREPAPAYGHYILAVNHNANRHGRAPIQWQRIELTNVDTGRMDDLDPVFGDPAGTVLYVGRAHAGRYRISSFKSVRDNIISTMNVGSRAPGMEFEVTAGAVVDAGTVVAFQMGPLVATARIASSPQIAAGGLAHLFERYRSLRGTTPVIAPLDADSGERITALLRTRPAWRGEPLTVADRTLVPAKLGNLGVHDAAQGWRSIATGVTEDLTAVAQVAGAVLIGTETGQILTAAEVAGPFVAQTAPPGTGPVRALLGLADGRALAVALQLDGTEVEGLRVLERSAGAGAWVLRESLPTKLDMPYVLATSQGLVVQTQAGRIKRLDAALGTWEDIATPLHLRSAQADGTLMALDYPQDSALSKHVRVHVSADLGRTWTVLPGTDEAGTPLRASLAATRDAQGAYRVIAKPLKGWLIQSDQVYRLLPGASAWTPDAEFRSRCRPMVQGTHWTDITVSAWWTVGASLVEACADGQQIAR